MLSFTGKAAFIFFNLILLQDEIKFWNLGISNGMETLLFGQLYWACLTAVSHKIRLGKGGVWKTKAAIALWLQSAFPWGFSECLHGIFALRDYSVSVCASSVLCMTKNEHPLPQPSLNPFWWPPPQGNFSSFLFLYLRRGGISIKCKHFSGLPGSGDWLCNAEPFLLSRLLLWLQSGLAV